MGYYVSSRGSNVRIRAGRKSEALHTLRLAFVENYAQGGGSSTRSVATESEALAELTKEPEWKRQFCKIERRGDLYGEDCTSPDHWQVTIPYYAWVNDDEVLNAISLEAALAAWRWECVEGLNGDVAGIEFVGEKYSEDMAIPLHTLAPFIEPYDQLDQGPAWIEMQGEEGEVWRYRFIDGQVSEVYAELTWPE